jgi:hypothetical protein
MLILSNKDNINNLNKDYNYIDINNKQFIFNNYKTKSTYNSVIIDIPDNLMNVINLYLKYHNNKKLINKKTIFFLVNYYGENISQINFITKMLNKIFNKKISVSMLRNIYLTSKYSLDINNLEKDTALMGTSINNSLNNYIKLS